MAASTVTPAWYKALPYTAGVHAPPATERQRAWVSWGQSAATVLNEN